MTKLFTYKLTPKVKNNYKFMMKLLKKVTFSLKNNNQSKNL